MKTFLLSIGLLLFYSFLISGENVQSDRIHEKVIPVWSTHETFSLSTLLIEKYSDSHTGPELRVQALDSEKFKHDFGVDSDLGFTLEGNESIENKAFLKLVIGRNVIVPVMHSQNPFVGIVDRQGVSLEKLAELLHSSDAKSWGMLLGNNVSTPVSVFVSDAPSVQSVLSDFLGMNVSSFQGVPAGKVVDAIRKNPGAIGFVRLSDVLDAEYQGLADGVKLLPVDKNGNGVIDFSEKIYGNLNDFRRGVWIGKYPRSLVRNIYAVLPATPDNEALTDFVSWVLTDGQQYLGHSGYTELALSEKSGKLDKLLVQPAMTESSVGDNLLGRGAILAFVLLIGLGLLIHLAYLVGTKKSNASTVIIPEKSRTFNENFPGTPEGLYFDKTHTWIFMERDGKVRVGIDDFLQNFTGKYTRIKMKKTGDSVKRNEPVVTLIQDGKHLDICAPVSGTVKAINEALTDEPERINNSPYNEGWIYLIEPLNWLSEIRFFKMGQHYRSWLRRELLRLKDFFAVSVHAKVYGQVVFQDGGEICEAVLQEFGPEVWEDFQKHFLDVSKL
jgi:glycine cleavage system H lipoate-binding protein/ABC-type phosphate transport system substrate-binding protein